jgi:hypothetical protein
VKLVVTFWHGTIRSQLAELLDRGGEYQSGSAQNHVSVTFKLDLLVQNIDIYTIIMLSLFLLS